MGARWPGHPLVVVQRTTAGQSTALPVRRPKPGGRASNRLCARCILLACVARLASGCAMAWRARFRQMSGG